MLDLAWNSSKMFSYSLHLKQISLSRTCSHKILLGALAGKLLSLYGIRSAKMHSTQHYAAELLVFQDSCLHVLGVCMAHETSLLLMEKERAVPLRVTSHELTIDPSLPVAQTKHDPQEGGRGGGGTGKGQGS